MTFTLQAAVFAGVILALQSLFIFWSFRLGASAGIILLVALQPLIGLPLLLYRHHSQTGSARNAAGAAYLVFLLSADLYLLHYPVQAIIFGCLLMSFQIILVLWSVRRGTPADIVFPVALLPFAGVPLLLYRLRAEIRDNHVAGALTYLVLMISAFCFIIFYPNPAEETEIPWPLIHTMQFFGFLGLANLVMAPLKEPAAERE